MYTTEASGGHDLDSDLMRDGDGSGYGRRAVDAEREREAEIASREFGGMTGRISELLELFDGEPHDDVTVQDAHSRRHRSVGAYRRFALTRDFEIDRCGESLNHNRGLERHDAAAFLQRSGHLVVQHQWGFVRILHADRSVLFDREFPK